MNQKGEARFCPAMWLSGFFALGALVHLVRFVLKFGLVVAGHEISVGTSGMLGLGLAVLSIAFLVVSLKKPCERKESQAACFK